MKIVKSPLICASTLLLFSCYTARADHKEIQGRTGLPKVIEGKNNVSIEKGVVYMDAVAGELMITQEFWLHYPGPPLERGVQPIRVAVREDYYRGRDIKPAPPVTTFEAKGFTKFNVYMDGRKIETMAEPWKVNSKRDTASRLRTWDVTFMPGETRRMKIVSRAPLGDEVDRKYAEFVSKDVGNWRGKPDYIEIRFHAPGKTDAKGAGLEPRPKDIKQPAIRRGYTKGAPNPDRHVHAPHEYNNNRPPHRTKIRPQTAVNAHTA